MATIVRNYVFRGRRADQRYPLDEWFDGQKRRLRPGVDFTAKQRSIIAYLRTAAGRWGVKLRINTEPDRSIVIQSYGGKARRPTGQHATSAA